MSQPAALRILKWSIYPTQSALWRYDPSDWGGVPPVLIFDTKVSESSILVANLHESENYYSIKATGGVTPSQNMLNNTGTMVTGSLVSRTVLAVRQGMMKMDDIIVWSSINQYAKLFSISLDYSNGTDAFPLAEWPAIQVYSQVYGDNALVRNISRSDSSLDFLLTNPSKVGIVVLAATTDNGQASVGLGSHVLSLSTLNSVEPQASSLSLNIPGGQACMLPSVFLSSVHNSDAALNTRAVLGSSRPTTNNSLAIEIQFRDRANNSAIGVYGPEKFAHSMALLTASACMKIDQSWYRSDSDPSNIPDASRRGTIIFVSVIVIFGLILTLAAFYIWKRLRVIKLDQEDQTNETDGVLNGGMADELMQGSSSQRSEGFNGSGVNEGNITAIPNGSIRIQPTGALRPPKYLTTG